jgi:hypothetical protein
MAALIGKKLGRISLERTGRYLGRDGSTLVRDVGRLEKEMKTSGKLRQQVAAISARIQRDK